MNTTPQPSTTSHSEFSITVDSAGAVQFIYSDELRPLLETGHASIKRASHVEPVGTDWQADMSPSNGPILGPFTTRQQALDAEVDWLIGNVL